MFLKRECATINVAWQASASLVMNIFAPKLNGWHFNTSLKRKGIFWFQSYSFSALKRSLSVSASLKRNPLFTGKFRQKTYSHSSTILKTNLSVFVYVVWYRVMIHLCSNNTIVTDSGIIREISRYLCDNCFARGILLCDRFWPLTSWLHQHCC